jgi:ribosomal protein S18 acetylase RimI-like enzyme
MEISIIKGSINNINACEEALSNSELGKRYFGASGSARRALVEGFEKGEIYTAMDSDNNCVGFIWFILEGVFHSFPYIHIIAVNEKYRNLGIGKKLLEFFEDICFKNSSKSFLVVADFNPKAKELYENIGYNELCAIPDLYRKGITEHLMMKLKSENSMCMKKSI